MILDSGKKQYEVVSEIYHGEKNDVVVCKELQTAGATYKTMWVVNDRTLGKKIIELFFFGKESGERGCEKYFLSKEKMCFVFPYSRERSLKKFYLPTVMENTCNRPQIWMKLVTACMTCGLPDVILYLILKQNRVQIGVDGSVWFQYGIDLSKLDEHIGREDCVTACAKLLISLMKQEKKKHYACELLEKKLKRKSYTEFIDLYKDIHLIATQSDKKKTKKTIKEIFRARKDKIYRVLLVISICLLVVTAVIFISTVAFGEFPLHRLFWSPIEQIGTESLIQ